MDADPSPIVPNLDPTSISISITPRRSHRLMEKGRRWGKCMITVIEVK